MSKILFLFMLAFIGSQCEEDFSIPSWFPICPHNDDFDDCLLDAIKKTLPHLAKGALEFKMPSIDPYLVEEMKLEYKQNQITAKARMTNIYVSGVSTSKIRDVRASLDDKHFNLEVDMFTPRIFVEGDYKVDGRFQALRVNSKGYNNVTMSDVTYTWKISGIQETHPNEKKYIKINKFSMRPDVKDMNVYLSNLFPGNEELTELGNALANQYWRVIYSELLPYVEVFWNNIGCKEANRIFQKIPVDELFPKDEN